MWPYCIIQDSHIRYFNDCIAKWYSNCVNTPYANLVTLTWQTQTVRVWHSSVVNTLSTSCCHQRHTHKFVGRDRKRLLFSQNKYTITVYLKVPPNKNSSSSQILRLCAQWEHTLDSLPAQAGSDTHNHTTPQTHTYAPCILHIMCTAVGWYMYKKHPAKRHSPNAVSMFF